MKPIRAIRSLVECILRFQDRSLVSKIKASFLESKLFFLTVVTIYVQRFVPRIEASFVESNMTFGYFQYT